MLGESSRVATRVESVAEAVQAVGNKSPRGHQKSELGRRTAQLSNQNHQAGRKTGAKEIRLEKGP